METKRMETKRAKEGMPPAPRHSHAPDSAGRSGASRAKKAAGEKPSRAEVVLHPVSMRIMMTLEGREMTTQQIGEALPDIAKTSLYRHMSRLCEVNVVRVVRETPIRGTLEKVYAVQTQNATLNQQELASATAEDHARYFHAFIALLLAQFRAFAQSASGEDASGAGANLGDQGLAYSTNAFYLTDAEYEQTATEIAAVLRPRMANAPDGERRRRLINIVALPETVKKAGGNTEISKTEKPGTANDGKERTTN